MNLKNTSNDLLKLVGSDINDFTITKYINSGSFGDVFEAKDKSSGEYKALKIPIKTIEKDGEKWLLEEAKVYKNLNEAEEEMKYNCKEKFHTGIAKVDIIKSREFKKKIIIMDLLGPSLEEYINKSKIKRLGLKSIILLTIQMIEILKFIHDNGYIHRDIKPDNFVMDYKKQQKVYCIDFGLAKNYIKKDGSHNSYKKGHKFCGTARYASINAHKGIEQSRRDDLESLGYMIIYLFKSKLPWMNIKSENKQEKYKLILEKKEQIKEEELCNQLPREFLIFLKYIKTLDFDERPMYSSLINMFKKLYLSRGYKNENFEWEINLR